MNWKQVAELFFRYPIFNQQSTFFPFFYPSTPSNSRFIYWVLLCKNVRKVAQIEDEKDMSKILCYRFYSSKNWAYFQIRIPFGDNGAYFLRSSQNVSWCSLEILRNIKWLSNFCWLIHLFNDAPGETSRWKLQRNLEDR